MAFGETIDAIETSRQFRLITLVKPTTDTTPKGMGPMAESVTVPASMMPRVKGQHCTLVTGVTHDSPAVTDVYEATYNSKIEYTTRHNDRLFVIEGQDAWDEFREKSDGSKRWLGFSRFRYVRDVIRQEMENYRESRAAFVLWIDADACITNPSLPLAPMLEWFGPHAHFFATNDINGLHTGTFAFRVSEESLKILDLLWESDERFDTGHWFEQGAMAHLIETHDWIRAATCILPKRTINGYPNTRGYNSRRKDDYWHVGDFILHVPGMPYERRLEIIKEALAIDPNDVERGMHVFGAPALPDSAPSGPPAKLNPGDLFASSWAAHQKGDVATAEHGYKTLLSLTWDEPQTLLFLTNLLCSQNRYEEALTYSRQLCAVKPQDAPALTQQAGILGFLGAEEKAGRLLIKALSASPHYPNAGWNYSLHLLKKGDYKLGFDLTKWEASAIKIPPRHHTPEWDGTPYKYCPDALYVWAAQGLGDTLMYLRFLPLVRRVLGSDARIILEVQAPLVPLIDSLYRDEMATVDRVIAARPEGGFVEGCNIHVALPSLPRVLGIAKRDDIPTDSYITADYVDPNVAEDGITRVGVCWKGNRGHGNDFSRSLQHPAEELAAITSDKSISLYSLVPEEPIPGAESCKCISPSSLLDTARVIAGLDIVLTVDTAVAHLAGAMGKPVLLLNAKNGDWRWGMPAKGESNDWYPSVRVLRQNTLHDWSEPIARAAQIIRDRAF